MARKIIKDISANTLQVLINQLCGLLIFYILSMQLDKPAFGAVNWCLAVLLAFFGILSFGIDQVLIKKTAADDNAKTSFAAYSWHVLIAGLSFYLLIVISYFLFPGRYETWMLLCLGAGKLCLFLASPAKQLANGLERFRLLLWMNTCSNIIRTCLLLILAYTNTLSLENAVLVFLVADVLEAALSMLLARWKMKGHLSYRWNPTGYSQLLKEALPQMGVVMASSILSRLDWILLGILASAGILANYSFAYKVFEVATLPLLIIAPVLIPRFSRRFSNKEQQDTTSLLVLLRIEMLVAGFTVLLLNLLWVPVIDWLTAGKYGSVNRVTIALLSGCIPFLYLNNFLWTMHFAQGRLAMIFRVFAICVIVNIAGNAIAIPWLKAEGAAAVYLLTMALQSFLFLRQTTDHRIRSAGYACLLCPPLALGAVYAAMWVSPVPVIAVITGVLVLVLLLWIGKLFSVQDIRTIKKLVS